MLSFRHLSIGLLKLIFCASLFAEAPKYVPNQTLQSSVDALFNIRELCLEELLHRLSVQLRYSLDHVDAKAAKDILTYEQWKLEEVDDKEFRVRIRPSLNIKGISIPASISANFFVLRNGSVVCLSTFVEFDTGGILRNEAALVFPKHSVWRQLLLSKDFLKRSRDWPMITHILVSYEDVCGLEGQHRIMGFGYQVNIALTAMPPGKGNWRVSYCVATGLEPAIDTQTGVLYKRNRKGFDAFPPTESGRIPGAAIDAIGDAKLFRFLE